jgi:hypothetical protein
MAKEPSDMGEMVEYVVLVLGHYGACFLNLFEIDIL